eukprot:5271158-Pleurochrysis_carterae.AAC.1
MWPTQSDTFLVVHTLGVTRGFTVKGDRGDGRGGSETVEADMCSIEERERAEGYSEGQEKALR